MLLQVLVLSGHGHGARPVLNRLGGVGKRRAAAPTAAGAGAPHRVATAAIILVARGPPPLSSVAPPDRVVAARAATPLAPGWLLAAVPATVIVVGTSAAVVVAPTAGHRKRLLGFFGCNTLGRGERQRKNGTHLETKDATSRTQHRFILAFSFHATRFPQYPLYVCGSVRRRLATPRRCRTGRSAAAPRRRRSAP